MVVRAGGTERLALLDMSSAGPFACECHIGDQDMTDAARPKPCSPAAMRMRLSRSRRRDGMRVVPFEVRNSEIDNLVALTLLDPARRDDRVAIARALGTLLDRIPIRWWQEAIRLRQHP